MRFEEIEELLPNFALSAPYDENTLLNSSTASPYLITENSFRQRNLKTCEIRIKGISLEVGAYPLDPDLARLGPWGCLVRWDPGGPSATTVYCRYLGRS